MSPKGRSIYGEAVNGTALLFTVLRKGVIMRVSQHSGRAEGSAKHNDRSFMRDMLKAYKEVLAEEEKEAEKTGTKVDRAELWKTTCEVFEIDATHIDPDREHLNLFWSHDGNKDFAKSEREYYKKTYSADLERKNQAYLKKGHPESIRTIDDVLKNKKTAPEELLLAVGKMGETASSEIIQECFQDYIKEMLDWNNKNNRPMKLLNVAFHVNEDGVPHLHIRRSWHYKDKYGNLTLNQNKALENAGIELPDPNKKISRYNNRKITFDAMMRKKWLDICEKHGLKVEREPVVEKKRHQSVKDYKYSMQVEGAEKIINAVAKFVKSNTENLKVMTDRNAPSSKIVHAHSDFVKNANVLKDEITNLSTNIDLRELTDTLSSSLKSAETIRREAEKQSVSALV